MSFYTPAEQLSEAEESLTQREGGAAAAAAAAVGRRGSGGGGGGVTTRLRGRRGRHQRRELSEQMSFTDQVRNCSGICNHEKCWY